MRTKAVRLYGKSDLRLEDFELPDIRNDEILAQVVSDSICMSSYKAAIQGVDHKRIPKDIANNPTIIGHEFSLKIIEVGKKWQEKYKVGSKYSIQPALNYKDTLDAPGYSYKYIGGNATYVIIPNEVMEMNCLLEYTGKGFFPASLAEPLSCIVGAFNANYHVKAGTYIHKMGIVEGGNTAILAGVGPMGLAAIDYAIHCNRKPASLVVTDIDDERIDRAKSIYTVKEAKKNGIDLIYLNTKNIKNPDEYMVSLTDGKGFDDVFVFAAVKQLVEQGDRILARDGCLNFFAGPSEPDFKAEFNFYNVHYSSTHIAGTSGGNNDDMAEALKIISEGRVNPAAMITHVGGLDSVIDTTLNLPKIAGGKKLIYTHIEMELTALTEFREKGKKKPLFAKIADILDKYNGLWSVEAEEYLLKNAK